MEKKIVDISVITVSYNSSKYTIECLKSLFRETTETTFETIVIDNASIDDSVEQIKINFPQVNLIESKENYGFARANNIASKKASGKYILLLNPDTVVLNHAVDNLYKFAEKNPEYGIYGGRTIFPDGSVNPSAYSNMTLWSLFCSIFGLTKIFKSSAFFNPVPYGNWKYDTIKNVDIISGCFLMLKRDMWEKLNGFNSLFFMYAEEVDLCLRAKKLGCNPVFFPEAQIIHYRGVSEPTESGKMVKILRGEVTLMNEHWTAVKIKTGVCALSFRVLLKLTIFRLLNLMNRKKFTDRILLWNDVWSQRKTWKKGWQEKTFS
ncbi:MAG: glycosyltransferase family 2 protein [Spirochaetes bacterium]|nr:glycosyltransferase family 2 protein [Spirochaetota bacterium]